MTKAAFEHIKEGMQEALAVARGDSMPFQLHVPEIVNVRAIRERAGMTQKDFAGTFGFGLDQIKQWEQGRVKPVQAMRAYLLLISDDPPGMAERLRRVRISA